MVTVNFESWLIGFIEGEGSFVSSGSGPVFSIVQKDGEDIMLKMKEFFGTGRIYQRKDGIWFLAISGQDCWPVRNLCEGKLQLDKKRMQFERWKESRWYNLSSLWYRRYTNTDFVFEDWLIGFIEAEGSFTSLGNGIYPEFSIAQKDEKETIERIQRFFGCGKVAKTGNGAAWQLRISGRDDCEKVKVFCEGKLQLEKRRVQFEGWKQLKWEKTIDYKPDRKFRQVLQLYKAESNANGKVPLLNV